MKNDEMIKAGEQKGWPVDGGYIIHSNERETIDAITGAVLKNSAKLGSGKKIKERYRKYKIGAEKYNAPVGIFAMIDNVLVGGITYHLQNDWVFLHCGYVWEQYRGMGVYSELMKTLETAARNKGMSGLFVSTYDFEAPKVYEHMGFSKGAILTNCPDGNTSIDYFKDFSVNKTRCD